MTEARQQIATLPKQATPPRGVLQRKCACGRTPGPTGACAACRRKRKLHAGSRLQPKLRVNTPGDRYEREADRMADAVTRRPASFAAGHPKTATQRLVAGRSLQRAETAETAAVTPAAASQITSLHGGGRPLKEATRAFFESRFGHDFSQVRVHTGTPAAAAAASVQARAFTLGRDVAFGANEYHPETPAGRHLIAHELTHVIQQGASDPDRVDRRSQESGNGLPVPLTPLAQPVLQRACGAAAATRGSAASCIGQSGDVPGEVVLFKVNCDDFLTADEQHKVEDFADSMSDTDTVEVHGYASVDGPASFNEALSCARAERVAALMRGRGVAGSQVSLFMHGETPGPAGDRRSAVLKRAPSVSRLPLPQLSATITAGPTPGTCGDMNFVVQWNLSRNAAANGGYVLQDITITWAVEDCSGADMAIPGLTLASPLRYFEVWRAAPNSTNLSPVSTDTFRFAAPAAWCSRGSFRFDAVARYHDDVPVADLPAHMTANNPNTAAGTLQSSTTNPNLRGRASRDFPHSLEFHWDCCPCQSSPTVVDQHTP